MTKKKSLIITSIVLSAVLVLLIVFGSVFTLQKVDFQLTSMFATGEQITSPNTRLFKNQSPAQLEGKMYQIVKTKKGSNLLFCTFDQQTAKLEKEFPFVKVEKVVRHFPNKVIFYYSEREPIALLETETVENRYYVVDSSLKVLDVVNTYDNTYNLPVLTSKVDSFDIYEAGQTITSPKLARRLQTFVTAAFSVNGDTSALYEVVLTQIYNVQELQFYAHVVGAGDSVRTTYRCKFTLKNENGLTVTYIITRIDQTGGVNGKAELIEKFKAAIQEYKENYLNAAYGEALYRGVSYIESDGAVRVETASGDLLEF